MLPLSPSAEEIRTCSDVPHQIQVEETTGSNVVDPQNGKYYEIMIINQDFSVVKKRSTLSAYSFTPPDVIKIIDCCKVLKLFHPFSEPLNSRNYSIWTSNKQKMHNRSLIIKQKKLLLKASEVN